MQTSDANSHTSLEQLAEWFSPIRMSTFAFHSNPEALYVWNTQITKALLEDIQHVEVLLRNKVDASLRDTIGELWFISNQLPHAPATRDSVIKAINRTGQTPDCVLSRDKVIAELSLDFWFYLFTKRYSTTVWPRFIAQIGANPERKQFYQQLGRIYRLRNRCAHHEPIVKADFETERKAIAADQFAMHQIANWIDPLAAEWIKAQSRVDGLRAKRP